jgi:flotillin
MDLLSPTLLAVVGLVLIVLVVVASVVRRIKVAGPNEAFIITGRKSKRSADPSAIADLSGQKVVMGASVFVLPFVQQLHVMDLSSRRISVSIQGAVSAQGVKVHLDGVAIVKVGGNEDLIRAAAQRFLDQQGEIEAFTQEVLAGSLRSIVGGLTVEEIIRDRAAFAAKVAEESETSLTGQGLILDTFQIQDVRTEGSYLDDLGRPEQARVQQQAAIAEAKAREASERERLLAEEKIAEANRQYALKQAEIKAETDAAAARAAASGPLAEAEQSQAVLVEQEKVAVRNAALKERQLDTEVRKPADAERYRVETEAAAAAKATVEAAEAARAAKIANAEASAREQELAGAAEKTRRLALADAAAREQELAGAAEKTRRLALADATQAEGLAEAAATEARGTAQAEAMRVKAEAFKQYNEAAVLQMLVEALPEVVAQSAAPLGNIDQLTVISTDGAGQLPRQVASNVAQGMQLLSDVTGVDLGALLSGLAARYAPDAAGRPDSPAAPLPAPPSAPTSDGPGDDVGSDASLLADGG